MRLQAEFNAHSDAWQKVLTQRITNEREAKAKGWSSWEELVMTALDRPFIAAGTESSRRIIDAMFAMDRSRKG